MSVSRSFATLSPYYVYRALPPKTLGFGDKQTDFHTTGTTIAASPSVMIASSRGDTQYSIWYTSDAKNWTRASSAASAFGSNQIFSMCFGNGIFVAVGDNAVIATSPSTDGGTWTSRTRASGHSATAKFKRVFYLNDKFFIWDENGYVSKSTDGITWSAVGNINSTPSDGAVNGGSSTFIYNSAVSALYAFPDNYQQAANPNPFYSMTTDDFASRLEFNYSGSNGQGARYVYSRNFEGYQAYIATSGRTAVGDNFGSNNGGAARFIEIARTTTDANTYQGSSASTTTITPLLWPTSHKIPSLGSLQITSNSKAEGLPAIFPLYGGAAGSQGGFWVNYENGYWNLIGNVGYQYGNSATYGELGCMTMRWKAEENCLEDFYAVRGGAMFDGTSAEKSQGGQYNFSHRVTQVNGGNEVVFKDKVYICAIKGSGGYANVDLIVGSRKLLPLRTTINY